AGGVRPCSVSRSAASDQAPHTLPAAVAACLRRWRRGRFGVAGGSRAGGAGLLVTPPARRGDARGPRRRPGGPARPGGGRGGRGSKLGWGWEVLWGCGRRVVLLLTAEPCGVGGLERCPAVPGKVDLRPGVGVARGHVEGPLLLAAEQVADGHPAREPGRSGED